MMDSIWTTTSGLCPREALCENLTADAVVIGGGIAGILTAWLLQEKGVDTVLLEADRICSGQTGNTTAKITLQHGLIYHKLIEKSGREQAGLYAEANRLAIAEYERIIEEKKLECGFRRCSSYLYSRTETERLRQEAEAAHSLGICARFTKQTELPFEVKGALRFYDQAVFHPLLFLKELAAELRIYEQTKVTAVEGHEVITSGGRIGAPHIVFATHYPFINVPGFYFLSMHQERSYVLALRDTRQMDNIYYGIDQDGLSFRKSGELMLLGGGSHRTGENREGGRYRDLRLAAEKLFPRSREVTRWSAQDCMPADGIPYIGRYAADRPGWYVATGFKKWGMTSAMVAGMLVSDLIIGNRNPWEEVFTPQRLNLQAAAVSLMEDGMKSVHGLSKGVFSAAPRCPHMGCALEWNPDEQSWDCPCHGSRFDSCGRLIDNPAQEDLSDA